MSIHEGDQSIISRTRSKKARFEENNTATQSKQYLDVISEHPTGLKHIPS
jgi:hypothetical protein